VKPRLALTAFVLLAGGCGRDHVTPPSPSPSSVTITITPSGVSPKDVTVAPGSQVTFANSDSRDHYMYSNPHPEHTDCPAINDVGFLAVGSSKQTGNLNVSRTCGYHDHERFSDRSLQGTITVQ
jgi:plastocyanin